MYILIETYQKDIMFVTDTGRSEWSGLRGEFSTEVKEFSNKRELVSYIKGQSNNHLKYSYKIFKGQNITKEINKNYFKRKKDPIGLYKFFEKGK